MLINGKRALAHTEKIEWVRPIEGADNIELVGVLGWTCIAKIGEFKKGDTCVYIEIDSKVPEKEWSEFLRAKHFKIKTMKLGKFNVVSQGIALPIDIFEEEIPNEIGLDVTNILGVTYSSKEDRSRKSSVDKYKKMVQRKPEIFKKSWARWMMRRNWGKKVMFFFFGSNKYDDTKFPKKFEYIHKTDQERVENMPWVLDDKIPFIRTEKCDGCSATYILERKKSPFRKNKYEFYVCSRNMRLLKPDDNTFFGDDSPYWEMAVKYDIENKLKELMNMNSYLDYICWQGEICGPKIQGNPHGLKENHLFLFHMIDSVEGMYDIRDASFLWASFQMEMVPIEYREYTLPDDLEEFKLSADGKYSPTVCEGQTNKRREGYVYYKTTDPNFSFKNVSREYLLKKKD